MHYTRFSFLLCLWAALHTSCTNNPRSLGVGEDGARIEPAVFDEPEATNMVTEHTEANNEDFRQQCIEFLQGNSAHPVQVGQEDNSQPLLLLAVKYAKDAVLIEELISRGATKDYRKHYRKGFSFPEFELLRALIKNKNLTAESKEKLLRRLIEEKINVKLLCFLPAEDEGYVDLREKEDFVDLVLAEEGLSDSGKACLLNIFIEETIKSSLKRHNNILNRITSDPLTSANLLKELLALPIVQKNRLLYTEHKNRKLPWEEKLCSFDVAEVLFQALKSGMGNNKNGNYEIQIRMLEPHTDKYADHKINLLERVLPSTQNQRKFSLNLLYAALRQEKERQLKQAFEIVFGKEASKKLIRRPPIWHSKQVARKRCGSY